MCGMRFWIGILILLLAGTTQAANGDAALARQQITNGRRTPGPKLANGRPRINLNPRLPDFVRKQLK